VAATGPEVVMAARSAGAEGEKSVGMAGVARLVSGSKGAAEQTRSRETALRVPPGRFSCPSLMPGITIRPSVR
jgi:hypothetical protein